MHFFFLRKGYFSNKGSIKLIKSFTLLQNIYKSFQINIFKFQTLTYFLNYGFQKIFGGINDILKNIFKHKAAILIL